MFVLLVRWRNFAAFGEVSGCVLARVVVWTSRVLEDDVHALRRPCRMLEQGRGPVMLRYHRGIGVRGGVVEGGVSSLVDQSRIWDLFSGGGVVGGGGGGGGGGPDGADERDHMLQCGLLSFVRPYLSSIFYYLIAGAQGAKGAKGGMGGRGGRGDGSRG